jgi:dihydroneopterin aldolase
MDVATRFSPASAERRVDDTNRPLTIDSVALDATKRTNFYIRQLHMEADLGLCDWEKSAFQPVIVDLEYRLPSGLSCISDLLTDTIDHRVVVQKIRALAVQRHFDLVETLAEQIAHMLQTEFGVSWVALSVTKERPHPSLHVGVAIERGQL